MVGACEGARTRSASNAPACKKMGMTAGRNCTNARSIAIAMSPKQSRMCGLTSCRTSVLYSAPRRPATMLVRRARPQGRDTHRGTERGACTIPKTDRGHGEQPFHKRWCLRHKGFLERACHVAQEPHRLRVDLAARRPPRYDEWRTCGGEERSKGGRHARRGPLARGPCSSTPSKTPVPPAGTRQTALAALQGPAHTQR
jgi:hypothetical protein